MYDVFVLCRKPLEVVARMHVVVMITSRTSGTASADGEVRRYGVITGHLSWARHCSTVNCKIRYTSYLI